MVATTDCIEESRPTVGKKVRGKTYWKEVDQSTDHKITRVCGELLTYLVFFPSQVSKPIMEKKRRARINKSLDQLKTLLESYYSTNVSKQTLTQQSQKSFNL